MNRKWENKTKLKIVTVGLKGNLTVSEIYNNYSIAQSQYYKWRDN
ncbi:MAG: transposase [bacterium]|nr:transposase [bacterium]